MNILAWYVLRKFLRPFITSFFALCLLLLVSQIFDRLDRFLADGVSLKHVIGFLITSMPYQALQILPVACLLGTLFVVGNLSRTREYIAGLAGGVPPETFLKGLFIAGIIISFAALFANETVIPPANRYARDVFREKIRRLGDWRQTQFTDVFVAGQDGRMWSVRALDQSQGKMDRPVVDTYREGGIAEQLDAVSAQWSPKGWNFREGVLRSFAADGMTITRVEPFLEKTFPFAETPSDLVLPEPEPEEMTYRALKRHIRHLSALGVPARPLEVELMMKLAFPFSCFVVIVLGVPLALRGKGSAAIGIAAGGLLTLFYMGFMQFGKAMAQRLVAPWVGAWMANIAFLAVGLILWVRMRRMA